MGKVTQGAQFSGFSGNRAGVAIRPQRMRDASGALQVQVSAGTVGKVQWQAKLRDDFDWVTLWDSQVDGGLGTLTAGTEIIATELPVLPNIRCRFVGALSATFNIYYME